MRTIQFNFNNEADILVLNQEIESGIITIPGQDGLSFETVQMFAEYYATARNIAEDRLKNWVLIEDGTVYSFVLRAGTAGIASEDIEEVLADAIEASSDNFHTLVVEGFRARVENADNIVDALVHDENPALAQLVYDYLVEADALLEPEVDERSELEIALDEALEDLGTLAIFARSLNLPVNASKEDIMNLVEATNPDLVQLMDNTVELLTQTTEVRDIFALSALVGQVPVGKVDEEAINKLRASAGFASRDSVNIRTFQVGVRYIRDTFEYVALDELTADNVRILNGVPVVFKFDVEYDAVIEPEVIARREERLEAEAEMREAMEAMMGFDDFDEDDFFN